MNGPRWIKQWIADLALLNEQFRNDDGSVDFEALGREEYMFRTALITQKLEKSERARETFMTAKAAYDASSENGKKGGRPRKNQGDAGHREAPDGVINGTNAAQLDRANVSNNSGTPEALVNQTREGADSLRGVSCHSAPSRKSGPMPANVQEVYDFASLEGLDKDDAYECWYVTTAERDGNDADGNPVTNWKAFVRTWCNTRSKKRSA